MIVAINPKNKYLSKQPPTVVNQGQLLAKLKENPEVKVLIDVELPGLLRIEDFLIILQERFPKAEFSTIGKEDINGEVRSGVVKIILSQLISFFLIITLTTGMPQQYKLLIIVGCSLILGLACQLHAEIIDFLKQRLR